jgi:hypothetical protein
MGSCVRRWPPKKSSFGVKNQAPHRPRRPTSRRVLREAELGLEGPAVGSDVDEAVRKVLSRRRDGHEREPEGCLGRAGRELPGRQRGASEEIHGQTRLEVGEPRAGDTALLFLDPSLDGAPDVGNGQSRARGSAEQAERAHVAQRSGIDLRRDVAEAKRRVEDDIAGLVAVVRQREVGPDGVGRVGPRLEGLGPGAGSPEGREQPRGQRRQGSVRGRPGLARAHVNSPQGIIAGGDRSPGRDLEGVRHAHAFDRPLRGAGHTIVFDFTYAGPGIAKGGTGVLTVDGKELARRSSTRFRF